jgi:hypothetical protein
VDIGEQGWEWAAVIGTTRTEAALLAVDHLVLAATVPALG